MIVSTKGTNASCHLKFTEHDPSCTTNDCMAWRYSNKAGTEGYCGLAGVPNCLLPELALETAKIMKRGME